jgi:methylated-DNA-protein-cysteine methyltransferase-like protein
MDQDFFEKVYEIVRQIPMGKVTTYGYIGQVIGLRSSARMVGWALNAAALKPDIPCHRVVNRLGELSGKRYFATPTLMRELLESEGVRFIGDAVDISRHLWIPGTDE